MKFIEGAVVMSNAGRDFGDFQILMKLENSTMGWVCDGRHRPIEKMKKKKKKHLKITNTILDVNKLLTNKIIRNALKKFNESGEIKSK